jgi:signal recognition particle subunit SRP54
MFTSLTERLGSIADRLKRQSTLRESDILLALREVRLALLEADVALPVVKAFINEIKEQAIGQEVIRSVTPGQQIIKIVHDHLVTLLGSQTTSLKLSASPPMPILMVGLQGAGKTTTSAKIALYLKKNLCY